MDINELRSLIALADHGSLNAAARALGVDRTTVRRRLEALEARFDRPLLVRDRRGVALTHVGHEAVGNAREMVVQAERMFGMKADEAEPRGHLRVVSAAGMPLEAYGACARFAEQTMPRVTVTFAERDDPLATDLASADVLVFWGPGDPGEAWRTAPLHRAPIRLLASPAYLEEHGTPGSIAELIAEHRILSWASPGGLPHDVVIDEQGTPQSFQPAAICASPLHLFYMAFAGAGIAMVAEDGHPIAGLPPGTLTEVLPGVLREQRVLYISYRRSLASDPRVAGMCERIEMLARGGAGI